MLKGIEANIAGPSGELDLPDSMLAKLDIVFAGFHTHTGYDDSGVSKNTRALIGALENPYVDGIVHPGNPVFQMCIRDRPVPWLRLFSVVFSKFRNQVTSPLNCVDIIMWTPL